MHTKKKNQKLYKNNSNKNFYIFDLKNSKVKPKTLILFNDIISNHSFSIFNYFTLKELSILRCVNKIFLSKINRYYELRLKIEINKITNIQYFNMDKTSIYMKNIDTQIPINNDNIIEYDINLVIKEIKKLDREIITGVKTIKKISQQKDIIYAPFCIIFGKNDKNGKLEWKKIAENIMNDNKFYIKLSKLNYENMDDERMLECFYYLNDEELRLTNIKRVSPYLVKLIKWCRAVFSYHILIHPYKYRNEESKIEINSNIYKYAVFMDEIISKFYKFKYFLNKYDIIHISLGDYIFNINYNTKKINHNITRDKINEDNNKTDENYSLKEKILSNILSYIPLKQSYKFIKLNKFWVNCFKKSIYINCYELLKEIYEFKKYAYNKLYKDIPYIYENNILGEYFLMLDDILNSTIEPNISSLGINYITFLSKEHLLYLKKLNYNNNLIYISVSKIFCILFNIKCEKKVDQQGNVINLYYKSIKLNTIKGAINKMIRNLNILNLKDSQLKLFYEEMTKIYNYIYDNNFEYKINEIKNINKGIYQLFLWEICVFEFLKEFNPFIFLKYEYFIKNKNKIDDIFYYLFKEDSDFDREEKKKLTIYYIDELNFLKYNLIFKYHFHSIVFNNISKCPSYEFSKMIKNILEEYDEKNEEKNNYEEEKNNDSSACINDIICAKNKIAEKYFKYKNSSKLFFGKEQLLLEKAIEQIILMNRNTIKENNSKNNLNDFLVLSTNYNDKNDVNYNHFLTAQNNKKSINIINSRNTNNNGSNLFLGIVKDKNNINKNSSLYYISNYSNDKDELNIKKYLKRNKSDKIILTCKKNLCYSYFKNTQKIIEENNDLISLPINWRINSLMDPLYRYSFNTKKSYYYNHITNINDIPNKIIIMNILLYLDINTFQLLINVSRKFLICVKTHMFYRLQLFEKEKKSLEYENENIIKSIENKRNKFYNDYLKKKPNKDHALTLIKKLNYNDITELKAFFKKYNKTYEIIISPMILLLGYKPIRNFCGKNDYFSLARKILLNKDFKNIVFNLNIDIIPYESFQLAEKIYEENIGIFDNDKIKYSKCLKNVIYWIKGVLEFHRDKRFYSMSFYDYDILNKEEQAFCSQMDLLYIKFYQIKYYINTFCFQYKKEAFELMEQYNIKFKSN